jgi:hypothetical protein
MFEPLCCSLAFPIPGMSAKSSLPVSPSITSIGSILPIDEIKAGEWCVVLYRDTCSHCRDVMDDWIDLSLIDYDSSGRRWVFIDIGGDHRGPSIIDFTKHKVLHGAHEMPNVKTPMVLRAQT